MTNMQSLGADRSPERSEFVNPRVTGPLVVPARRDMLAGPAYGSPFDSPAKLPPARYYRVIQLEYWFAALCAGGLAWAALLKGL